MLVDQSGYPVMHEVDNIELVVTTSDRHELSNKILAWTFRLVWGIAQGIACEISWQIAWGIAWGIT